MAQHSHEDHGIPLLAPEPRDADIGLVVKTGVGVLLFMVVCVIIARFHYNYEIGQQEQPEASPFSTEQRLPSGPRLQAQPASDLVDFRASQAHVNDTYGWVDKAAGIARIPVERAIGSSLEKGFPLRTPETEKIALANALKAAGAKAAAEKKAAPAGAKK